jgi:hypothetical protein
MLQVNLSETVYATRPVIQTVLPPPTDGGLLSEESVQLYSEENIFLIPE